MSSTNEVEYVGYIANFAQNIGASEDALRLLLSLLAGYPLAFVHRLLLYGKSPWLQHLYFTLCGIAICYFNFGPGVIHSIANILVIYVVLLIWGGSATSVIVAFVFNMVYLCVGYYTHVSNTNYVITWTTPHCVLTLRLIGLAFDVYDGQRRTKKEHEDLSSEQKDTALHKMPSLLEVTGHTYFFGGFLVGPQFPMKRYQDFVAGKFSDPLSNGLPPDSVGPAFKRLSAGFAYTLLYQVASLTFFNDNYMLTDSFRDSSFLFQLFYVTLWGKFTLYKYLACWIITEGCCTLTGLTYNGKDENGNNLWDGCANIYIRKYESAASTQQIIASFNVNTNKWMAKYVFKRLRFLGNKEVSQITTLFFLALWHGLHTGYFMCFFLEFLIVSFERSCEALVLKNRTVDSLRRQPYLVPLIWFIGRVYSQFALSYSLVGFCLLSYPRWGAVYWSMLWAFHIFLILWLLLAPRIYKLLRPKRRENGLTKEGTKVE